LGRYYCKLRHETLRQVRTRAVEVKTMELLRFVASEIGPGCVVPKWTQIRSQWNKLHPQWEYSRVETFQRQAVRELELFLRPRLPSDCPDFWVAFRKGGTRSRKPKVGAGAP